MGILFYFFLFLIFFSFLLLIFFLFFSLFSIPKFSFFFLLHRFFFFFILAFLCISFFGNYFSSSKWACFFLFFSINRFGLNQEEHTTEPNTQKSHFFSYFFPVFFCYSLRFWRFFALIYGNDCSHTVYILYPNGVPQKFHFFCTVLLVCAFFRFFLFDAHPQSIFWRKRCYSDISIQFKIQKEQKKISFFSCCFSFCYFFILFFKQNKKISPNENLFLLFLFGEREFSVQCIWCTGCCWLLCAFNAPSGFSLKILFLSRVFLTFLRVGLRENVSSMGTSGARKIHQLQHKVSLNCHFSITHQKKHK